VIPAQESSLSFQREVVADFRDNGNGTISFVNSCPFQVHYYWVLYSKPNIAYSNYMNKDQSEQVSGEGEFRLYACNSAYYVVGPDGEVVHSLVQNFSCQKK